MSAEGREKQEGIDALITVPKPLTMVPVLNIAETRARRLQWRKT